MLLSIIYIGLFVSKNVYYVTNASMVINSKTYTFINGVLKVSGENDIYLAQKMVNTYRVILLSDNVLEKVNHDLGISIPTSLMRSWVSVTSPRDTEVITVTVTNKDPKLAADIANSIMRVAPQVIQETVEVGSINVLDKAKIPQVPVKTNIRTIISYIFIGGILGILFGGIAVLLINVFNPKLKNKKDVNKLLSLKCIGEIPHIKKVANKAQGSLLVTSRNVASYYKEEYKNLAEMVIHICEKRDFKTLMVSSAVPEEGKTSVSVNLALSLALAGKRTLLVDFDCYQEGIRRLLRQKPEKYLNNILSGEINYTEAIVKEPVTGLDMLFSKKNKYFDYNLMNSPTVKNLLDKVCKEYDYIIIDTPPVLIQTDALLLSKYIDGVVFVVRQETAPVSNVIEARDKIHSVGAKIIGCVINDIRYLAGTGYRSKYNYSKTYYNKVNDIPPLPLSYKKWREGIKRIKVTLLKNKKVWGKIITATLFLLTAFVFIFLLTRTGDEIIRIRNKIMNLISRYGLGMEYLIQFMDYWAHGILFFVFTIVTLITLKSFGVKTLYKFVIALVQFVLLAFGSECFQALFVEGRMYEIEDVILSILGMLAGFAAYGVFGLVIKASRAGKVGRDRKLNV
jgi:succinoglycan biosynthesis transport protein ExoP